MDVIGIDIGFGFTKATNGRHNVVFKSVYGEAAEIAYREQLLGDPRQEEYLHLEVDGRGLFLGDLAERHSNVRSFTLDQNQLMADYARVLALAALSRLTERNTPVNLVTGLPVNDYRRHREELAETLKGKHEVTLVDAKEQRSETVVAVNQVRVIPQPFGSLFDRMLNDAADVSAGRFAREKVGIIDVGFRTADYAIADHTRFSARGSATTEAGVSRAFAMVAARLKEQSGVDVELYRLYRAVESGSIKIRGRRYDLAEMTREVFTQLAAAIAADVERLWHDDWDIDVVLVTGGGGATLAPYLKDRIENEVITPDPERDGRLANVRGYWKYGHHLWERAARTKAAPAKDA